jgi:6-phosphogluconolactonase
LYSRRRFLAASAALPWAVRALAEPKPTGAHWVLIGTGTEQGIFRATFDPETGALGDFEAAAETSHPTYLALHPTLPMLYASNELPEGDGTLSSFRLDRATATLTPLGQIGTEGNGPCYLSLDHTGRMAFAANYGGGNVTSVNLAPNGEFDYPMLYDCKTNLECGKPGPLKVRQEKAHMHCAAVSPDNRFVLACDLGDDAIQVLSIPPRPRTSPPSYDRKPPPEPSKPQRFATRPGSGPRHVAFHPNGRWVYCIHELDCTLELFDWTEHKDGVSLDPRPESVVSTLPAGHAANGESDHPNTGCELAISPNGKSLYANTRGANTLAVYTIASNGLLTEEQRIQTGGTMTRYFTFDPSRKWLLCANQGSSTVTVFSHDTATGKLGDTPKSYALDTPMFVMFV